jgi:hypothetical protein
MNDRIIRLASLAILLMMAMQSFAWAQRRVPPAGARGPFGAGKSRGPSLPAPFDGLSGAAIIEMSKLSQLSVHWLAMNPPPVDGGDPVIDLFGPFGGQRETNEAEEELPENKYGLLVLTGLEVEQIQSLLKLTDQQFAETTQYLAVRRKLLGTLRKLRETTKADPAVDHLVKELGAALGKLEGEIAFQQAIAFVSLAETLTDKQRKYLQQIRSEPKIFNMDAAEVVAKRTWITQLDERLQLPLQDLAAKAGSFLTGTGEDNFKAAPKRSDLLGPTSRRESDEVLSFLKKVNKVQYDEYMKLLQSEGTTITSLVNARMQVAQALDLQKKTRSTSDAKVVLLSSKFGETEARLALQRVRSFERIRLALSDEQQTTLKQLAQ